MTRLERLRGELATLADGLRGELCPTCRGAGDLPAASGQRRPHCGGCWGAGRLSHPLAQALRGIAWSLLPREERYREPEHSGGPLTSGAVDVDKAAVELGVIAGRMGEDFATTGALLLRIASDLSTAVVQARPGETFDDVLRRECLEIAEAACATCSGQGFVQVDIDDLTSGRCVCGQCVKPCTECRNGCVVADDAIEVRCSGQTRYARRRDADDNG